MHSLSTSIVAPVRNSSSLQLIRCAQIKQSKMFIFTELCKPLGHEGESDWERVHNYKWDFTYKIAIWALHHLQRKQCIRINQLKVTVLLPVAQYVTNTVSISVYIVGLCDMDKKYISRFFYFFFDFNHDFDKQTCFISHLTCFSTSYLFLHILSCTSCFALFFILLHILLFFFYLYIYMLLCGVTFI